MIRDAIHRSFFAGLLIPIILKLLQEKDRLYGYQMREVVLNLTGGGLNIREGSLYPALHKLERQGLVVHEYEAVNSRMRKYYRLTAEGERAASTRVEEARHLLHNLGLVLDTEVVE